MSRLFSTDADHPEARPASDIVDILRPIWQRVLDRPVSLEDNFFDLGGNPSLALKLFSKISQVLGHPLAPEMIYLAPTLSSQAAILTLPTPPRIPPLLLLKSGVRGNPIFITHGLGASVLELFEVVRYIRSDRPIYGMQAKGIDGLDKPFDRVEDLAGFYLYAIKKLQPYGPYYFIGYSFGGLVTLEMARRLSETREEVALLALLDSYPHPHALSLSQRLRLFLLRGKRRILRILKSRAAPDISSGGLLTEYKQAMTLAWSHYRPRFYAGKVTFVKAAISSRFPEDPRTVWGHFVKEFELETVPGDHVEMMTTQAPALAVLLSRRIAEPGMS